MLPTIENAGRVSLGCETEAAQHAQHIAKENPAPIGEKLSTPSPSLKKARGFRVYIPLDFGQGISLYAARCVLVWREQSKCSAP